MPKTPKTRLDRMEAMVNSLTAASVRHEESVLNLEEKMGTLATTMEKLAAQMKKLVTTVQRHEGKIDGLGERLNELEDTDKAIQRRHKPHWQDPGQA